MKKFTGYASAPNASIHGDSYRQQLYEHSPVGITENEEMKILWDFTIQTDHELNYRRPDITVHDNNNRVLIMRYLATTTLKAKRVREREERERQTGKISRLKKNVIVRVCVITSSETQGQTVGARESLNGWKNKARRKEKNGEKGPWGQCLTRPVLNGRRRSGI